ncbi:hypothetical protein BCR37DRAFT_405481 [Protomyces lactucae-debilis]|uniref:Uncharacterized protein n=1 Tax=Protomyces lactucae-debilis TaxID=2754530 RepID=A0A1Y2F2Q7_PROLT|nr:uncharacterized protein BCR37DRAFT_405481 [Protomyces lactucae-debilis]ORY78178.1 hypothetical protein BCR37DRAFT_405481 [Protomyces lactucae-debilis]
MPFRGAKRSLNARFNSLQVPPTDTRALPSLTYSQDEVGLSKVQPAKQAQQQTYDYRKVRSCVPDEYNTAGKGLDLSRFRHHPTDDHASQGRSPLQDLGGYDNQRGSYVDDKVNKSMAYEKADDSECPPLDYNQQSHWFSSSQHPSYAPDQGHVSRVSSPPAITSEPILPFSRNPKRLLDQPTSSPVLHRPFGRRANRPAFTAPRLQLPSLLPVGDEFLNEETWLSDADLLEAMGDDGPSKPTPRTTSSSRLEEHTRTTAKAAAPQKKQLYIADAEAQYKRACEDSTSLVKAQAPGRRRKRTFDPSVFATKKRSLDISHTPIESEAQKVMSRVDRDVIELSSSDVPEAAKSSTQVVQQPKRQRTDKSLEKRVQQAERCAEKKNAFFSTDGVFVPSWAQLPSPAKKAPEQGLSRLEAVLLDDLSESEEDLI